MGYRTPKVPGEERNWSVILNPLSSELDRKRVGEKISELFHISPEDARELVQNTPIILLDRLSHPAALRMQNIFQGVRANVTLTSDHVVKRRCFRALWPEEPNLSFLESPAATAVEEKAEGEISSGLEKKCRELEILYQEQVRENQALRQNLEKELSGQSEKETHPLRSVEGDWEERYQNLKAEYHETKEIYEEKILARERDFEALKGQLEELDLWRERCQGCEKEIEALRTQLKELSVWQEKVRNLDDENKAFQERIRHLEADQEALERTAKERSEEVRLWREKYQARERELEALRERVRELEPWVREASELGRQNREFQERLKELESAKREIERFLKDRSEEVNLWREKYHLLAQKSERFESLYEAERKRCGEKEEAVRQASELAESWQKRYEGSEENQKRLEQEFSQISRDREDEIQRLREMNRELQTQLEATQRQGRDLLFRIEQQELIEKRGRLASELAVKEAQLKELVFESERLQREIHERELQAQTLANEQTGLEREILEAKQAQRYLLEQSKLREKSVKSKRPGHETLPERPTPGPAAREVGNHIES